MKWLVLQDALGFSWCQDVLFSLGFCGSSLETIKHLCINFRILATLRSWSKCCQCSMEQVVEACTTYAYGWFSVLTCIVNKFCIFTWKAQVRVACDLLHILDGMLLFFEKWGVLPDFYVVWRSDSIIISDISIKVFKNAPSNVPSFISKVQDSCGSHTLFFLFFFQVMEQLILAKFPWDLACPFSPALWHKET